MLPIWAYGKTSAGRSNHSLRASGITNLLQAGVPKKLFKIGVAIGRWMAFVSMSVSQKNSRPRHGMH